MDESNIITLLVGFGGVVLGGAITYFTERQFRRADQRTREKRNFQSVLVEVSDALSSLMTLYKSLVSTLPSDQPDLISTLIREMASVAMKPSSIETEKLFSVGHKEDQLFTPISLFLKRYNASIATFVVANELKNEISKRWITEGVSIPTENQDIAQVGFNSNDHQTIAEIVKLENLYRQVLKNLELDIKSGYQLIERLNGNSDRKFKKTKKQERPRLEITKDFIPVSYIQNMPFFDMSQLPISNA